MASRSSPTRGSPVGASGPADSGTVTGPSGVRSRQVSAARPGNAQRALGEHERILSAVEAGDADGARREMREHLANTARDIGAAIREGEVGTGGKEQG